MLHILMSIASTALELLVLFFIGHCIYCLLPFPLLCPSHGIAFISKRIGLTIFFAYTTPETSRLVFGHEYVFSVPLHGKLAIVHDLLYVHSLYQITISLDCELYKNKTPDAVWPEIIEVSRHYI
jgi:hypothetical protein